MQRRFALIKHQHALSDLTDFFVGTPADGDVLTYDSGTGLYGPATPTAGAVGDLTDVDLTGLADGDTLVYDSGTMTWLPGAGGGGASALDDLSDVTITAPATGAILQYSGSAWVDYYPNTLAEEILADAPRGYWKLDGATTATDSSGNGYDMTEAGTVNQNFSVLVPTTPSSTYAQFPEGANGFTVTSKLGTTPPLSGDYTIEGILCIPNFGAQNIRIFVMSGSGETEAANYQTYFGVTTTGLIQQFWEYGAGTNATVDSGITLSEGVPYHLACVKDGTANTITFYVNGIKLRSVAYANEVTGGTGTLTSTIGYDGTGNTGEMILGHVAFYASKLTDARIRVHAQAAGLFPTLSGVAGGPASDHGSLTGLGDDDHPQYPGLTQAESISGQWTWTTRIIGASATASIGTPTNPSYTFAGDENTGWFSGAADQMGWTTGGTTRMGLLSNGQLGVYDALTSASSPTIAGLSDTNTGLSWAAADTLALVTGGTARLTLTTALATSSLPFHVTHASGTTIQIEAWREDAVSQADITATTYNLNGGGTFHVRHARGTRASPTASQADDITGGIGSRACYSAGNFHASSPAAIHWQVTENQGASNYGMWLRFLTTPKASTTRQEAGGITDNQTFWCHDSGTFNAKSSAQTQPISDARFVASGSGVSGGATFVAVTYDNVGGPLTPGFRGMSARGTPTTPTASQTDDFLCFMGGHGYGSTGFSAGTRALVGFKASQTWTDANQGAYITLETTPNGSTSRAARVRIPEDGGMALQDGISAPATLAGWAILYVDTADGDLKVKFGDGTVKTIATDT